MDTFRKKSCHRFLEWARVLDEDMGLGRELGVIQFTSGLCSNLGTMKKTKF
jgi:hypothetical protein